MCKNIPEYLHIYKDFITTHIKNHTGLSVLTLPPSGGT